MNGTQTVRGAQGSKTQKRIINDDGPLALRLAALILLSSFALRKIYAKNMAKSDMGQKLRNFVEYQGCMYVCM